MLRRLIVPTAAGVLLFAVATPASAQAPGSQTLTLKEVGSAATIHFVDNIPRTPRRRSQLVRVTVGEAFVFSTPLRDAAGKPFGRLRATCFITKGGTIARLHGDCLGVYSLPNGQLWGTATTGERVTNGVILGGTGAYAGMHGSFVSTDTKTGADDTITLVSG